MLNALADYAKIYQIDHDGKQSQILPVLDNDFTDVFEAMDLRPSDYLMANGMLFVEGKFDLNVFKKWLGPSLNKHNVEIIPFHGKHKLHFYARAEILEVFSKRNFKYFFLLDRDEGNQRIIQSVQDDPDFDEDIMNHFKLLEVREIENFLISPEIIKIVIMKNLPNATNEDYSQIQQELFDLIQSNPLYALEITFKKFLDEDSIRISFNERNNLLDKPSLEAFKEEYTNIWTQKMNSSSVIVSLTEKLDIIHQDIKNKMRNLDSWKILPGKKVLKEYTKYLQDNHKINLSKDEWIQYGLLTEPVKRLIKLIHQTLYID